MNKGKLYVVATPIDRYDVSNTLVSYRDQNHNMMMAKILEKLNMGLDLALISDCGTPLISDPGYRLVAELRGKEYEIVPIPGPSALIAALSVSGLPTDKFCFLGFLPKTSSKKTKLLEKYLSLGSTLVVYESPNRLFDLLELVETISPDVTCFLARDISKLREKHYLGSISGVRDQLLEDNLKDSPHGEWVCIFNSVK